MIPGKSSLASGVSGKLLKKFPEQEQRIITLRWWWYYICFTKMVCSAVKTIFTVKTIVWGSGSIWLGTFS